MVAATLTKTSVQFGFSPADLLSARTHPVTLFTNLSTFSIEPWSRGHLGWPVTFGTFGFK